MSIAYGIDVLPSEDPYVSLAYEAVETLSYAGVPGRYLVVSCCEARLSLNVHIQDALPILKYVPSWFPGAKFKRDAKEWKKLSQRLAAMPLEETKRQMVCFTENIFCLLIIRMNYRNPGAWHRTTLLYGRQPQCAQILGG